ncbi:MULTISPECIES: periplasmic nitrate reductase, NapE protein [Shewanella]|uniref:Periplasmic nitrate reductase, NapE protein n=1 Tax=Shewanella fidelis TaxID=173509 RepID=A0AAW8NIT2_9GAMM|nr:MULTISPECIES: periplasmic nitrate reductase, NapE protein [Shewanella]MDR8522612.1 periplasmic nitrate reductase, NapE protein [Shewanella fidelis]MDW4812228.1 periplasmic nitrate reductase, NapE protein [Shewanella fidelis]MDW4816108.1 periplasmic nitrate reductase, NapE protein [Shewanella fidelis]MDW4820469.1 periplasmic nitrate reductase, NapE protein [Shewanella fidelis]MDW4824691.1 periplasmic nitrate reductase, NapE protein [Shewanella fidelis]
MTEQCPPKEQVRTKKDELKAVGFIIFILFPALAATFVSVYGLIIWISLTFSGVASH